MSSERAFARAKKVIPGGVNSPVRAFRNVGGNPLFIRRASGAYVEDTDGRRYIDYVASYGPMINGHAHPQVVEAVRLAAGQGMSFGAPTEAETQLAEKIIDRVPGLEMVRMCNSGTEATMSAIRLARAATGRNDILKFSGCYHGHSDGLLVAAGSGALTCGVPNSPGIPDDLVRHTLLAPYNDIAALEHVFAEQGKQLAAVIVEPIAGNMNCVPPARAFIARLRELTRANATILIFDEVMTGFRVAYGGARDYFDISADLATFGKVIGGGLPVGAFAGGEELMRLLAPEGAVYQAGTLSGNPVAMAAGIANLSLTEVEGFYRRLGQTTEQLASGLRALAAKHGIALVVNAVCGMIGCFFTDAPQVTNFAEAQTIDSARFTRFFHAMLEEGVYLAPSPYETLFVSSAHDHALIDATLAAVDRVFARLQAPR